MPKNTLDYVLYGAFGLAVLMLANLYSNINQDDSQWNQFKEEHHCKLMMDENGVKRSSWECDDGKTYYRWRQLKD